MVSTEEFLCRSTIWHDIADDLVHHLEAEFLVRHLAAAEAKCHLDLVALVQELDHAPHLDVVIMRVDVGAHLDFLDVNGLLFLSGDILLLLRLILVFAIIEDLAYRRIGAR